MKIFFLLFSIIMFFSCKVKKTERNIPFVIKLDNYHTVKMYKIDSIKNVYVLYFKDSFANYKVVSRKKLKCENSELLKLGSQYRLALNQLTTHDKKGVRAMNYLDMTSCVSLDSVTIHSEGEKTEVYFAKNICGKSFLR